jgi:hypothetical protein
VQWLGHMLDEQGISNKFQAEARDFSFLHSIQTGSGTHPASYLMWTGGSFLGDKSDHSPPPSAVLPFHRVFMVWCLIKFWENFTFTFYQWWVFMVKLSFSIWRLGVKSQWQHVFCTNIVEITCLSSYIASCMIHSLCSLILWHDAE